ncbi:protein-N(5)-glutamine methyltransferase PrmB, methylates LSU ribosomal protein L3p [Sulfuriferula multivorans]|uniref:Ribosomal protein uL3 glutamine methyltransferase n=1 Tax=Sulfuriferula multivorans TaxID=1559896 RepID=A0A401JFT8_9PROT|nr:50S ribosomal protein L3 N(5)-glutamine methyltransferase [Sulfuriferula multivorans]GBL46499.1 protein-N(5)-glutamine methyltransferase PrmB, methylates LSU ribosomal protein L3p [Sulfuriferula multivorans]
MSHDYFHDTDALITVRDWLRFGVSRMNEAGVFFGHGTTNAFDEAAYLILHSLHLPLDRLDPFLDACLTEVEREDLKLVFEKRVKQRIPSAYITHQAWLGEFAFYVDERVIIPRSFIAELLREQLDPWVKDPESVQTGLDMCTGSGCLAILMAHAFPNAAIDAVDISVDALSVAQRNIVDYQLQAQVHTLKSDLFSQLSGRTYDVIVSNPPYVNATSMALLPAEYLAEPQLALASGSDGLEHIRAILGAAPAHLNPGGILVAEIGHNRDALEGEFPNLSLTWLDTGDSDEYVFLVTREQLLGQ